MSDAPTSELLGSCCARYRQATDRLRSLMEGCGAERVDQRPGSGRWSANECLAHLNLTASLYLDPMEQRIEQARQDGQGGHEPYGKGTLVGRLLLGLLRGDPRQKPVRSPKLFAPAGSGLDRDTLVAEFEQINLRLVTLALRADGLPLGKLKVNTPVSSLLKVTLAQAFEIHALHELRHMDQIERALATTHQAG